MRLKKKIIMGALLTCVSLPILAHADLVTNNFTDEPSTVHVTSGVIKPCSKIDPHYGITKPQEKNHVVPTDVVKLLCKTSTGNICEADIFMTDHCGPTTDAIAHAVLNLSDGHVTVKSYPGKKYKVDASGSTVNLRYAS